MSHQQELVEKVSRLVADKYGGDWRTAFLAYDGDGDGRIGLAELKNLLADAGVGDSWSRGLWARGIMSRMDQNADGRISEQELKDAIEKG